jgi:hypothetical protein
MPQSLECPEHFELLPDRAVLRLAGAIPMAEGVQRITAAIKCARAHKKEKLLVVANDLNPLEKPSVSTRYFFVREWAAAAEGAIRIAMVARPEMIDPEKFGVTVAANAGLIGDVFTTEAEAIAWLKKV